MAKGRVTYNKKEVEKRRLKKRKDKELRKEERKSNPGKEKTPEDMFAYVDETGKLVSTPPDPSARKEINVEDIKISISKREDADPADLIREGRVTFFNDAKGFGFIRDLTTREDVFVHINSILEPIKENDKVTFETERGPKGINAVRVKLAP